MNCNGFILYLGDAYAQKYDSDTKAEISRYYQGYSAFLNELHDIGSGGAVKWIRSADFKDMLYVRTMLYEKFHNKIEYTAVDIEELKRDSVVGQHFYILFSDYSRVTFKSFALPICEYNNYIRVLFEAWLETFYQEWMLRYYLVHDVVWCGSAYKVSECEACELCTMCVNSQTRQPEEDVDDDDYME